MAVKKKHMILGCVNQDILNIGRKVSMPLYNVLVKHHPKCCVHSGQTGMIHLNWDVLNICSQRGLNLDFL